MLRFKIFISCLFISVASWARAVSAKAPLTIDAKLQALGERLLQNKQGGVVAVDPATGLYSLS